MTWSGWNMLFEYTLADGSALQRTVLVTQLICTRFCRATSSEGPPFCRPIWSEYVWMGWSFLPTPPTTPGRSVDNKLNCLVDTQINPLGVRHCILKLTCTLIFYPIDLISYYVWLVLKCIIIILVLLFCTLYGHCIAVCFVGLVEK